MGNKIEDNDYIFFNRNYAYSRETMLLDPESINGKLPLIVKLGDQAKIDDVVEKHPQYTATSVVYSCRYLSPVDTPNWFRNNKHYYIDSEVFPFPHLSTKDKTKLAIYQSYEKFFLGQSKQISVGSFLTKYCAGLTSKQVEELVNLHKFEFSDSDYEIKITNDPDEIVKVYTGEAHFSSCMQKPKGYFYNNNYDSPTRAYGGGNTYLAYIVDGNNYCVARTICMKDTEDNTYKYIRLYGDYTKFMVAAKKQELNFVSVDTLYGMEVKKLVTDYYEYTANVPYVDGNNQKFYDHGDKFVLGIKNKEDNSSNHYYYFTTDGGVVRLSGVCDECGKYKSVLYNYKDDDGTTKKICESHIASNFSYYKTIHDAVFSRKTVEKHKKLLEKELEEFNSNDKYALVDDKIVKAKDENIEYTLYIEKDNYYNEWYIRSFSLKRNPNNYGLVKDEQTGVLIYKNPAVKLASGGYTLNHKEFLSDYVEVDGKYYDKDKCEQVEDRWFLKNKLRTFTYRSKKDNKRYIKPKYQQLFTTIPIRQTKEDTKVSGQISVQDDNPWILNDNGWVNRRLNNQGMYGEYALTATDLARIEQRTNTIGRSFNYVTWDEAQDINMFVPTTINNTEEEND